MPPRGIKKAGEAEASAAKAREPPRARNPMPSEGDLIRRRWRSLMGRPPPKRLPLALMERILAWREQVAEVGDIGSRSRAILAAALDGKLVSAGKKGEVEGSGGMGDQDPSQRRARAAIRVGTVLVREHAGVLHRVNVVADGFEWEGRIYASLSAVARAITGVRWNGRRFFALDRAASQPTLRTTGEPAAEGRRAMGARATPSPTGGG